MPLTQLFDVYNGDLPHDVNFIMRADLTVIANAFQLRKEAVVRCIRETNDSNSNSNSNGSCLLHFNNTMRLGYSSITIIRAQRALESRI